MKTVLSGRSKALAGLLLAGAFLGLVVPAAHANLILNGSFESPLLPVDTASVLSPPWVTPNPSAGGGGIVHPSIGPLYPPVAQEGAQYELSSSGGVIAQAFSVGAGESGAYQLTWYDNTLNDRNTRYNVYVISGSIPSVAQMDDSLYVPPIVATAAIGPFHGSSSGWNPRSLSMTLATGDYHLLFSNGNNLGARPYGHALAGIDDLYFALDNIDLSKCPAAFTITASASPVAGGSTSGAGTYGSCDSVTVVATANPGYFFVNWTEGGTPVRTSASYTFTATADRTLVANFAPCPAIAIDPVALPNGLPGTAYPDQTLTAGGGTSPYTFAISSGSLPPGLTLTSAVLSGTPTTGGSFTFTITATDANGCADFRTYTVQIQALAISCPPNVSVQCLDDVPAATTNIAAFLAQGGTIGTICSPPTLTFLGQTFVGDCPKIITRNYRVTDACGARADCAQTIVVHDTTRPTITCPGDIMIITGPGRVDFEATPGDICDPRPTVIYDHPPGSTFPMGETVVRCKARDACGNESDWCSFTVTVSAIGCPPTQQAILRAGDRQIKDELGYSVAVSGETIVVGASGEDGGAHDPLHEAGAAYVFARTRDGLDHWGEVTKLTASDAQPEDFFGMSVGVDGDTIVVGTPFSVGGGAAYVFKRNQGGPDNWGQIGRITALDAKAGDAFGHSVAISGDTIVVGAWTENGGLGDPLPDAGAAYVFERNSSGSDLWHQVRKMTASDAEAGDLFGSSVAINGDVIVVGAESKRRDALTDAGAAYVFARNRDGLDHWGEAKKLTASDTQLGDVFGHSVAIKDKALVVGAPGEDGGAGDPIPDAGAAYVFERNQGGEDNWGQVKKITASDAQRGDLFGSSVTLDGDTIVVGATKEDGGFGEPLPDAGAAYVFARNTGGPELWNEVGKVTATDAQGGDFFGAAVAMDGDTFVVGAFGEDGGGGDLVISAGAAYVFALVNGPCARDDSFDVPGGFPLAIPVGPLLGNDAHSLGSPIHFSGADASTAAGKTVTALGSPVTLLQINDPFTDDDTFTYRITDGTREDTGTVHLRARLLLDAETPQPNRVRSFPPSPDGGLTILFNAPAAGKYALERRTHAIGSGATGVWTEIARQSPTGPGLIAFVDARLPGGALYRVRRVP
jgi:hypothetical protein